MGNRALSYWVIASILAAALWAGGCPRQKRKPSREPSALRWLSMCTPWSARRANASAALLPSGR